jgi:asparagine synthase (glutamine-hydrolysing)
MCGFVGALAKTNKRFPQEILQKMTAMIHHRGPDDEGFFFHQEWLAMGFRRLSILDLSPKGHQPMLSEDKKLAIIFNGEVYNYREIRDELEKEGISFRSGTDTEVVLEAYRFYGEKALNKFTGMFAFIIADLEAKTAFIARDQLGIKPLFFFEDSNYFIFTSEIKSLIPYTSLRPDPSAVNEYLVFRSVIGERTMFKDVHHILPGHYLSYKEKSLSTPKAYFSLPNTFNTKNISFEESCEITENLLLDSIKLHLRSDVELGVQLSGGVDSSLITAIAAETLNKSIHSFSISFPDSTECDESEFQNRISKRYNTIHHDFPVDEDVFTANLQDAIWHYEMPLNDPNSVCTYHLVKKAKPYCTVMLSGEGADESFLGYTKFTNYALKSVSRRMFLYNHPKIRNLLHSLTRKPIFKVTKYDPAMYALSYADFDFIDTLLNGSDFEMTGRHSSSKVAGNSILRKIILQDEISDLVQWLWRADKIGMAASMELRVPFCTPQMFSLANSIPYDHHIRNGERKCVLKKIAEKYMDYDQIYRKKMGFGVPVNTWMKRKSLYSDIMENTLNSKKSSSDSIINTEHKKSVYNAYKAGSYKEHNVGFLWTYMNLELWYRMFFKQ